MHLPNPSFEPEAHPWCTATEAPILRGGLPKLRMFCLKTSLFLAQNGHESHLQWLKEGKRFTPCKCALTSS